MVQRIVFILLLCVADILAKHMPCIEEVDYLTNLITDAKKLASRYKLPENADEYRPKNNNTLDFGEFDFVIVGAGAAGTVVANRLSEIHKWKILLLEAGNFGNNITDVPDLYFELQFSEYNWGFYSTPQNTSCLGMIDRKCPLSRGKGIGGSTLINALMYSRGSSIDFDRWAEHVNDSRWSYPSVLKYFKKSEDFHHRDQNAPVMESVHGEGGYLNVEYYLPRTTKLNAFLKANEELGLPVDDYNAGTGLGASPTQFNTKHGRREDGGKAFIRPILKRTNLRILENSYVTKILIDEATKNTVGVSFTHHGQNYIVKAKYEVILCAGAVGSPQLLMLSGIGPRKHLESKNIGVIQDLEVGSVLRDHPSFYGLNFGTNYTEPTPSIKELVEMYIRGYGTLTIADGVQGIGFYESQFTKGTGYPDIEIIFTPASPIPTLFKEAIAVTEETYQDVWGNLNQYQTINMFIVALHTDSKGSIRLKSSDPFDYPVIDTNFLSDPNNKDIRTLYEGIQLGIKLANTNAMQEIGTKLQAKPLRACKHYQFLSEEYWYCAIRQVSYNMFHPVGTCPMGLLPEKGDVVNSRFQVYGINNLRVADASVFPFTLGGHPSAVAVMIGEQVSDILKEEYM